MLLWSSHPKWMLRVWGLSSSTIFLFIGISRLRENWGSKERDWMEFFMITCQLIIFLWADSWAQFEEMGAWNDNAKGHRNVGGVSICEGSRKTRLWFLSIHPKSTSLHFSELVIAVGEAQGFLHFHRCLFQGWLLASQQVCMQAHFPVTRITGTHAFHILGLWSPFF